MSEISQRKLDHIEISLTRDVGMHAPTGFERWHFLHEALPDLHPDDVDTTTLFLGREFGAPIFISSMTGGPERGSDINRNLAIGAAKLRLPMGVGSQRICFVRPEDWATFDVVRQVAPEIMLFGNLGAVQLNYGFDADKAREAVERLGGDGLILHLNPLQELIQPGGDTDFRGLTAKIAELAETLPFPIIAKEVGCGIGPRAAKALADAGVAAVDVAGAGGTSWAKIEALRTSDPIQRTLGDVFGDWGIPTATCLRLDRAALPGFPLIASGGIRTGLDVAKAIALGADMVALAMPLLGPATRSAEDVEAALGQILRELRCAMFLIGAQDITALKSAGPLLVERP